MPLPVEISTREREGALQVSKSRKLPVLVNAGEMESLFAFLGKFEIFDVSRPVTEETARLSPASFLEKYAQYVEGIKKGSLVDENALRPYFSAAITSTSEILYAIPLASGKYLIKANRPVIQMQRHHFIVSDTFHSGVMGEESITWGIQFSYPQLYMDPKTKEIGKVEKNASFPNTELFHSLAKWVRDNTVATPFILKEEQFNQPMRLGKGCFDWINNHPTLKAKGLYVARKKDPRVSD